MLSSRVVDVGKAALAIDGSKGIIFLGRGKSQEDGVPRSVACASN